MTWSTFAEHWWLWTNATALFKGLVINRTFDGSICPAHVTSRYRQQAPAEVWKTEFYFWSLGSLFSTVWGRKLIPGQACYPQVSSSLWSSTLERLLIYFSSIKKRLIYQNTMHLTMMESVRLLYLNHHVHDVPSMQVTENKQISQAVCPREFTVWGRHSFHKEDSVITLWEWGRAASATVAIRCFFVVLECELRFGKMAQWSRAGATL